MPRKKRVTDSPSDHEEFVSQLTGTSPEEIENEMISLAVREIEYRIRNHTASSAELVHYAKLGTEKERLEREKLQAEMELQRAKASAIESSKNMEELYENAIAAMKLYSGSGDE